MYIYIYIYIKYVYFLNNVHGNILKKCALSSSPTPLLICYSFHVASVASSTLCTYTVSYTS